MALLLASCAAPLAPKPAPTVASTATPTADACAALLAAGDASAAEGARTAAEAAYQGAAVVCPSDPTPYLRLARLYLEWNRPEEGLAAASVAERLQGPTAELESVTAALDAGLGDWEAAVLHGSAALALDPADSGTRHLVALGYVALDLPRQAREQYQVVLDVDPDEQLAHERLGVLLSLHDPAAALPHLEAAGTPLASDLTAALDETAGRASAHRLARVGQACLAHREPALAALALGWAADRSPAYADARALLGRALDQLSRSQEARHHLEAAAALAPESALARSLLGLHYLDTGDPDAARPHLEAAYDLDPGNPGFSLYLAWVYADLGQYLVAELWLGEAVRLAPRDPDLWEAVARFHLRRGLVGGDLALQAAGVLAELEPRSGTAEDLLGWAHFLNGDCAGAEEHLRRAIELDSNSTSAIYHLGQVHAYMGRSEEARAAFGRALDLNTDAALRVEIEQALDDLPAPASLDGTSGTGSGRQSQTHRDGCWGKQAPACDSSSGLERCTVV